MSLSKSGRGKIDQQSEEARDRGVNREADRGLRRRPSNRRNRAGVLHDNKKVGTYRISGYVPRQDLQRLTARLPPTQLLSPNDAAGDCNC